MIMAAHLFRADPGYDEKEFEEKMVGHVNTHSIPTKGRMLLGLAERQLASEE